MTETVTATTFTKKAARDAIEVGEGVYMPLDPATPITIAGNTGSGKSTLAAHLLGQACQRGWHVARMSAAQPDNILNAFGDISGPKLLVLDEAPAMFGRTGDEWFMPARQAREQDLCLAVVTMSLSVTEFGCSDQLRDHFQRGTVIHLWSSAVVADRLAETMHPDMAPTELDRYGHGYLSTSRRDLAEFRFGPHPAHS